MPASAQELPTVSIVAVRHASEAGLVPGAFVIARTGPLDQPLEVEYEVSGTASNGWDYHWLPGRMIIPVGQESVEMPVVPYDHEVDEPLEQVEVALAPRNRPFTLAILPDTQYYTAAAFGGTPEMLAAQTEWLRSQQLALNIRFVLHEGDCTDNNAPLEWQRFKACMSVLDGRLPYAVAVGNHDGLNQPANNTGYFNQLFGATNFAARADYGGAFEAGRMDNCYHLFSAGGVDWLVLSLEFGPRNAVLAWAGQVLAQYPNRRVIYLTHAHVYTDNTLHGSSPTHQWTPKVYGRENNGMDVWQKLLAPNANTALAFSGHVLLNGTGRLATTNAGGNLVVQMLANYQTRALGGSGYLRLARFLPEEDRMEVTTYSPFLDTWLTDSANQFEYRRLGIFTNPSPGYLIAPAFGSATMMLTNNDQSTYPPRIVKVDSMGRPPVFAVAFETPVEAASAETLTNYTFSGGARLVSARRGADQRTVYLTSDSEPVDGASCVLTVNYVRNLARSVPMTEPVDYRFIYRPLLFTDNLTQAGLEGWTVVDQVTGGKPSQWVEQGGQFFQLSNLFGPDATAMDHRQGTYVYYNAPEAAEWTDYAMTVTFRNSDNDGVGVLFHYQNSSNYYKLELDAQRNFRKLFRVVEGVETTLAQEPGGYTPGQEHTLRVLVVSNELVMRLNGMMLFSPVFDDRLTAGTVALYAWGSEGLAFSKLTVTPASFAPRIVIASPASEAWFNRTSTIPISVAGSDPDGSIVSLEIFDGSNRLGAFTKPPYDYAWTGAEPGGHTLYARALDDSGLISYSRPVFVRVEQADRPPQLVQQPASQLVPAGQGVVFATDAVSAGPVAYQWYYEGQPITGATNRLFFLNTVSPRQVGAYWVTAQNQHGATASAVSVLRVNDLPPGIGGNGSALRLSLFGMNELRTPLFALEAARPASVLVQTATSLTRSNWQPLLTVTHPGGTYYFSDPAGTASPMRFYRVIGNP